MRNMKLNSVGYVLVFVLVSVNTMNVVGTRRVKRGWMSGGRPADVPCAFDPCTVNNFCGTGRTCEIDKHCRHHCKCDPGSAHELCDAEETIATTTKSNQCTFNLCHLPSACEGNRKCSLDHLCHIRCECTSESTHESCVRDREVTSDTIHSAIAECDEACEHGMCVRSSDDIYCQCQDGWDGKLCNIPLGQCTLECSDGFKCELSNNHIQTCVPKDNIVSSTESVTISSTAAMSNYNICNKEIVPGAEKYESCTDKVKCRFGTCIFLEGHAGCQCYPGATGPMCETKCCTDCGENGHCSSGEDGVEKCICERNFTGSNCTLPMSQVAPDIVYRESTWYQWVIGVCVAVLVVLLVLLVVVPYVMWRHRVVLVMKIVHFFQGYEDDDDRQWDAFVSYKSGTTDEQFVVRTLIPKLEQELGFKLHLHFRDFVPGDTIANNIVKAVLSSRRTILIVTPEFAQAEWTKFEYHIAQQEMLKRRHRIIPIVLEEITEDVDPILETILRAVTYLEWPTCGTQKKIDKFWKRLELSMPKKRAVEQESAVDNVAYNTARTGEIDLSIVIDKEDSQLNNHQDTHINNGIAS